MVPCTRSDTRQQNPELSHRSAGTPHRRANNLSDAWEAINAWTAEPGYVRTRLTNLYRLRLRRQGICGALLGPICGGSAVLLAVILQWRYRARGTLETRAHGEAWNAGSARKPVRGIARRRRVIGQHRSGIRGRTWLGVALCQSLDLEHHLAAHHEGDRLYREASKREATLPIRGVVVPAPSQETAAAIGAGGDGELPG